jgi:Transposase DDE domain
VASRAGYSTPHSGHRSSAPNTEDASPEMRSAMSPRKIPTTVQKGNRCTIEVSSQGHLYRSTEAQCRGCPQKRLCTAGSYRRLFVHWQEPARQAARALAETPDFKRSQRYKVEALFAELKQQIKLRRVRLRRLWNVAEQFHLAATAQNLKRLVRYLAQKQLQDLSTT